MSRKPPLLVVSLTGLVAFAASAQPAPSPPRPGDPAPRDVRDPRDPRGDAQALERRADVQGRVTAVSDDGRTLTLAMPPRPPADGQPPARDARPEQTTVTLTDRTQLLFFGVGEGQARPAPGQFAMVWLAEGSKDQAARVRLMKREGEERPDVQGRVLSVSPDGRTVTVETRDRDQATGRVDLRIAPYTQSLYFGVDRDGARPTPDYQIVAWLEKGSKDTPVRIRYMKADARDPGALPQPR